MEKKIMVTFKEILQTLLMTTGGILMLIGIILLTYCFLSGGL